MPTEEDCTPSVFLLFQYLETRSTSRDTIRVETFYLARLRGVDVHLGSNPGVSAVSMSSAQLASIEDVRVTGASFHAGFNGLPGSGGFSANLEVEGGDYGVVQNQFRPNPSITGLRLVGQRLAGIVVDVSRGPLVVSGFTIQGPSHSSEDYRAVLLRNPTPAKDNAFNGGDGSIFLTNGAANGGTAVETMGADVVRETAGRHDSYNCVRLRRFQLYSSRVSGLFRSSGMYSSAAQRPLQPLRKQASRFPPAATAPCECQPTC